MEILNSHIYTLAMEPSSSIQQRPPTQDKNQHAGHTAVPIYKIKTLLEIQDDTAYFEAIIQEFSERSYELMVPALYS